MQNKISASTPRLSDLSGMVSPVEKKVKITSPRKEKNHENGEEWTEISLNNSPEETFYNNEAFSDEEEQIPYKRLPMDLRPEGEIVERPGEKMKNQLVTQQSLPAMPKTNEVSLSDENKAEVTRSPSIKNRSKVDSRIANWISRSSVTGETSGSSSGKHILYMSRSKTGIGYCRQCPQTSNIVDID